MRSLRAVMLCLALSGTAFFAQSAAGQDNGQNTSGSQPTANPSDQDSDPNRPVLKRRPKPDAQETTDSDTQNNAPVPVPQPPQAPQSGPVFGQRRPAPTTIPSATSVPFNTQFQAALDDRLSSKTSRPGDAFTATLAEPLRNSRGDVIVPSGAKLLGTVQEAESGKVFASMRGKGKLILRFNEIELPGGQRMPIQTTLLNVGTNRARASANQEGEITSGTRASDAIKKVGIGAGAGTIAGLIFGSAMKGAAIGAIAGGGYAMANAGKDVEIPAHTTLNLRLDQYLTIPGGGPQTH